MRTGRISAGKGSTRPIQPMATAKDTFTPFRNRPRPNEAGWIRKQTFGLSLRWMKKCSISFTLGLVYALRSYPRIRMTYGPDLANGNHRNESSLSRGLFYCTFKEVTTCQIQTIHTTKLI